MESVDDTLKANFTLVFKENRWGNAESVSGDGSALSSSTVIQAVQALDQLVRQLSIRSISDIPCGDFNWIPIILGRYPYLEYYGYDIVDDLIDRNRTRFPERKFNVVDIAKSTIAQSDMIFCKDLLLHLPNYTIATALRNFKLSGSRFLLITSVVGAENDELVIDEPGAYRHVDLLLEPFSFPEPLWSTNYLSLWALDSFSVNFFDDLCGRFPAREFTS